MDDAGLARELLAAYDSGRCLSLPPARDAGFSLARAYAVADRIRALRAGRGEHVLGYKIGFTNRTIWQRYGVHQPIWGPVWDSTVRQLDGVHGEVSLHGLVQPRIEPEVVFGFGTAPRAGMDEAALAACIDWVAHGIEIVHTHFEGWRFEAADTVADGALHGRLLIGPRVPIARFGAAAGEALADLRVELLCDGQVVDRGVGRNVLDGPLTALRLWVDALAAQPQRWPVDRGDIVTTGTLTDAWPMQPGQSWQTRLSEHRLADLSLQVVD